MKTYKEMLAECSDETKAYLEKLDKEVVTAFKVTTSHLLDSKSYGSDLTVMLFKHMEIVAKVLFIGLSTKVFSGKNEELLTKLLQLQFGEEIRFAFKTAKDVEKQADQLMNDESKVNKHIPDDWKI